MAILKDSRADCYRDILTGFTSIQAYEGAQTYYNPSVIGKTWYLGQKLGVPRRWFYGPHPTAKKGVWWALEPKVSMGAPRTEAAYDYEAATVTRFFMWSFTLASNGNLKWIPDTTSYSTIGQWHEQYQPNGGREPPFEVSVYADADGMKLRLAIAEDGGTGTSGQSTYEATHHVFELGSLEFDREYLLAVRCKAQGVADDFLTLWLDGKQMVSYYGYVGFPYYDGSGNYPNYIPNQGTYKQQNFFKIGSYNYLNAPSPSYRAVAHRGAMIGDANETYDSMYAAYMAKPTTTVHGRTRFAVAILGGTNVSGAGTSGAINRATYGLPCQDPVAPSTVAQASLAPELSSRLSGRGYGALVANCAVAGYGISTYVGRCRGTYQTNTVYVAGDSVTPATKVGANGTYMPDGLKYICEVGGTSGGTVPTWPTAEHASVTDNGIVWRAERRETYDTADHIYSFGELGFDPLGKLSEAAAYVDQIAAVDKKVLVLFPLLDQSQNTDYAKYVPQIKQFADLLGIDVVVSNQSVSTTPDDYTIGEIGRIAADEILLNVKVYYD